MREEIARLMSLQTIDRQLHELGQSLSSVAERVEQLRGEIETSQAELDRLTEEDQQAARGRCGGCARLPTGGGPVDR